jgi:hypothetical protein
MKPQFAHVSGKASVFLSAPSLPACGNATRSSQPCQCSHPQNGQAIRAPRLARKSNMGRRVPILQLRRARHHRAKTQSRFDGRSRALLDAHQTVRDDRPVPRERGMAGLDDGSRHLTRPCSLPSCTGTRTQRDPAPSVRASRRQPLLVGTSAHDAVDAAIGFGADGSLRFAAIAPLLGGGSVRSEPREADRETCRSDLRALRLRTRRLSFAPPAMNG